MGRLALLISVGTGVGKDKEKRIKSLAHGILHSIIYNRPDHIVFFGSEESKETIEKVKELVKGKNKLPENEFVLIHNIASFNELFEKIKDKIIEFKDKEYEVLIDYTSGTKTMSVTAAIAGALYKIGLCYVNGERKHGLVVPGTESVIYQNLFKYYNEQTFRDIEKFFNTFSFDAAKNLLNYIVAEDEKKKYCMQMINVYGLWDKFEHEKSFTILKDLKYEKVMENKEFLGELVHEKDIYKRLIYLLVDLINNVRRRIEEGKYDDAVARLYRIIELIAQIKLLELDLIEKKRLKDNMTFAIDLKKLNTEIMNIFRKSQEREEDILKLGLYDSFRLLSLLSEDLGRKFEKDKNLSDLLSKRNRSILAHGLEPVEKETAEKLLKKVQKLTEETFPEIKTLMKKAEFPKLEITEG